MRAVNKVKNQKGQTLIEAMVALAIAVTILAAITTIVITSLSDTTFSKNQNLASEYAQQALEYIRGLANANYSSFKNTYTARSYCLDNQNQLQTWSGNCNLYLTGIFTKELDFDPTSSQCGGFLQATATVSWSDSKCTNGQTLYCHKFAVSTCFTNINAVVSPI